MAGQKSWFRKEGKGKRWFTEGSHGPSSLWPAHSTRNMISDRGLRAVFAFPGTCVYRLWLVAARQTASPEGQNNEVRERFVLSILSFFLCSLPSFPSSSDVQSLWNKKKQPLGQERKSRLERHCLLGSKEGAASLSDFGERNSQARGHAWHTDVCRFGHHNFKSFVKTKKGI